MSKLGHSGDADMDAIERDARAREDAESAAMHEAELREEYAQFCESIRRDLDPIEAECGGCPTYREWLAEHRNNETGFDEVAHHA
jgi:hypothetical protein